MKNWQFLTLVILIIVWFGVLYYQNAKIYRVVNWIDYRDADIYKYLEWDKTLEKKLDWMQWLIYRLVEYTEE